MRNMAVATLMAVVALGAWCALGGEKTGAPDAPRQAAATRVAHDFIALFDAKVTDREKALAELLAEDFVMVDNLGKVEHGRDAAIAAITTGLKGAWSNIPDFHEALSVKSCRILGEVAVISGEIAVTGTLADSGRPYRGRAWMTLALREDEGRWLIVHETIVFLPAE